MKKPFDRKVILEDGEEYYGYGFGDLEDGIHEIVFNTSMVGYPEILSDPSYTYQTVVMTYPLIGNYGLTEKDFESEKLTVGGLIVKEYCEHPSNFRSQYTLSEMMEKYHIPGIYGIDTRKLVRSIRDKGSRKVLMTQIDTSIEEGLKRLHAYKIPKDAVKKVARKTIQKYMAQNGTYHVVAVDCGMKLNIVRCFHQRGCHVTVVPYNITAKEIESLHPDGVFLSNGPGDPMDVIPVIQLIKEIRGKYPIFGICLGHQLISLAYGAKTYKLKFGHRGGNHPVKNLNTGKVEMTSQNHSYAVDVESLKQTDLEMTHVNLLDHTVEGVMCKKDRVLSVQYHPESAPGPQDSLYLFDQFIAWMEDKNGKENRY